MTQEKAPYPGYIVEVGELVAGVALTERGGFAFVASDHRFATLEPHKYKTLDKIVEAVCEIIGTHASPPRRSTRPVPDRRYAARAA